MKNKLLNILGYLLIATPFVVIFLGIAVITSPAIAVAAVAGVGVLLCCIVIGSSLVERDDR